jgi:hypothetical protein
MLPFGLTYGYLLTLKRKNDRANAAGAGIQSHKIRRIA